ncbi:putative vacuolar amino acid transporter YPQ2 [Wickerhamiella sorbophila]|uniref:Putative vacuolar amino acid transporter YPQ2 n=1 Tax=Wickerhamiella sorbophila TaxID=45607 RepID=A0A2T0FCK1_9ASCO|nr:putative vacuolar amino acid transporter YPQ2 [Wickerhamiella sorbophila]PRT52697.1 putative vacuolar amino acid transporter YPQ2 [Wickerhamiella sorbophila]
MSERFQDATLSGILGTISICFWICAQCPQVLANYRHKHVDGMSREFLAIWFLGDLTALAGCLMTSQLLFQTLLASYYIFMDLVLAAQYYLYSSAVTQELIGIEPEDLSLDNSNRRDSNAKSSYTRRIFAATPFVALFGTGEGAPVGYAQEAFAHTSVQVGVYISYFSGTLYLVSRLPQILHNYRLKSCGLSVALVSCALMGNLFYSLSICLSPEALGPDGHEFLQNELPFLIGSAGTLILDLFILGQFFWYRTSSLEPETDSTARLRAAVNRSHPDHKRKLLLSHQSIYSDLELP